ncbi:MAG: MarR family winged helix-turn-helix transcriptional regulator [Butyricicoccaceae bacterium]
MKRGYQDLDKNNRLIWNFRDISHTMRRISEGKGGQKRILILLLEDGATTQSALTQRLGIQPGSASEVLAKLEHAGLIRREPSAGDRRTTDVLLTDEGRAAAEEARQQRMLRHDQMFACLSEDEKDSLLAMLEKINTAWAQQYGEGRPEGEGRGPGRRGHHHHGERRE